MGVETLMSDAHTTRLAMPMIFVVGIVVGVVLFSYNPADEWWMPKCPFFVLTGLKCPGCGTLRGVHYLLHLKLADAWNMNPFMILSIPLLCLLTLKPELSRNLKVGVVVAVSVVLYWIVRNLATW